MFRSSKNQFNPFYVLLVLTGIVFCITCCAYGVMTVRGLHNATATVDSPGVRMMEWLDTNGFRLLLIELGVLAVFTFAAIATDEYWTKREQARE